jgi:hypothetical protein
MLLGTIGHATLALREKSGEPPLLITDPWILGSCYWRSWWLERYPSAGQIDDLARARFCYMTHEHPDHFHPPSLRRLGYTPRFLVPEFSRDLIGTYLREHGARAETIAAGTWRWLEGGVRIASLPTLGNDSVLLIDTPEAFIADLNDARPTPDQLLMLRLMRQRSGKQKPCVVLASYSAAGIGNSLYKRGRRLSFAGGGRHIRYVEMLCRALDAQTYMAFASQVSFERPDTRWANEFRVGFEALKAQLASQPIQVLPPYTSLDLQSGSYSSEYGQPPRREPGIAERVAAQIDAESSPAAQELTQAELDLLADKLRRAGRGWLAWLCPRGVGFSLPRQQLAYDPIRGRLGAMNRTCSITLKLPAQAVKDVLATGFFSDLCIPMFTDVELAPEVPPHVVYAFFVLLQLHDVGATSSVGELANWSRLLVRERINALRSALA